jgi:adenine phosphoribosyltransferase
LLFVMSDRILRALRTIPDFPEPGIQFKDISPILADSELLAFTLEALVTPWRGQHVKTVIGIESRGFLFGAMMAERLGAGFAMVRKPGKLPAQTVREEYQLEYGSDAIEMHADAISQGDRVLIHDDVLATGGTAAATARLVERVGGRVAGYSFLLEIEALNGRARLADGIPIGSAVVV